jgi:hypothetical protein
MLIVGLPNTIPEEGIDGALTELCMGTVMPEVAKRIGD